jgi:hypothetical protein
MLEKFKRFINKKPSGRNEFPPEGGQFFDERAAPRMTSKTSGLPEINYYAGITLYLSLSLSLSLSLTNNYTHPNYRS